MADRLLRVVSLCSAHQLISVTNKDWTGVQDGFGVCAYFENNPQFNIPGNNAVPNGITIWSWVRKLEESGSTLSIRTHGRSRSIRTPEIEQSPRCSARRNAISLGISDRSLRRIVLFDLNSHPYKIMMSQELCPADHAIRQNLYEQMLAQITLNAAFFIATKSNFT